MRCERGSVCVVSPASSRFSHIKRRSNGMAIIGMDIHRAFAEVVALEGKSRRRLGRIVMRCDRLAAFAAGLTKDDIVVVEATGDATAVAEVVLSENPIRLGSRIVG